ncbi:DUF1302 domain-containing protein [Ideonella sp. TBM-1]|uniref:DUF1302 domain-containing protein n=2 Tax=Ideonella livida TaxID=2707176 RepID=A0A7C9TH40_9BURK|nr:DUF1302 domain-containing protein [Ideonella livida]
MALCGPVSAFQIDTEDPDLRILWDTTVKYSAGFRMEKASSAIVGGGNYDTSSSGYFPNTDDGSRNFGKGLVSSRLDLLTELDLQYKRSGFRVTGAAWRDGVYRGRNDNDSAGTANPLSVAHDDFTAATRKLHGGDAEVLDAFVFTRFDLGDMPASVRLGKHTLLLGESFMLGANGMAAAQAPIDVVKAATVPNSQFKEFMMPVNQVSGQLQVSPDVTVSAYYMLDWKSDRLPGSGSYFSFMDALGTGGERLIVGYSPAGNVGFDREADLTPKKKGQWGAQMRFHVGDTDYSLLAAQWNDHGPSGLYLHPHASPTVDGQGVHVGTYQWVFHEGIKAVGAGFSTTLGSVNLAGEMSYRWNTPLDSDAQVDATRSANNTDAPLYAVGKSLHAQVSWIASLAQTWLAPDTDFVGELAFNRTLSVTRNAAALNPNSTRDAANLRMVLEPKYRQVMPGVDLSVPVGLGYGLHGNSRAVGAFMGKGVGDLSVGLNGAYLDVWRFGLNYTHYLGEAAPFIDGGHRAFKQSYADRDYLSLFVRRTF